MFGAVHFTIHPFALSFEIHEYTGDRREKNENVVVFLLKYLQLTEMTIFSSINSNLIEEKLSLNVVFMSSKLSALRKEEIESNALSAPCVSIS